MFFFALHSQYADKTCKAQIAAVNSTKWANKKRAIQLRMTRF
jgi:hypothetical protein